MNVTFAVVWLGLGVGQALRDRLPYGLVVGLLWGLLAAAVWLIPAARIGDKGIRLGRRTLIAWSQVSDVTIPVDNGWKPAPAELVLVDGRREALPMLSRTQAMRLREHVSQQ